MYSVTSGLSIGQYGNDLDLVSGTASTREGMDEHIEEDSLEELPRKDCGRIDATPRGCMPWSAAFFSHAMVRGLKNQFEPKWLRRGPTIWNSPGLVPRAC